jgi:hypothetical protein
MSASPGIRDRGVLGSSPLRSSEAGTKADRLVLRLLLTLFSLSVSMGDSSTARPRLGTEDVDEGTEEVDAGRVIFSSVPMEARGAEAFSEIETALLSRLLPDINDMAGYVEK